MGTMIYQYGQLNTAGAMAPGAYVQIVKPPPVVAGVATNGYGLVGVASWGPVNSPVVTGSPQANQANWGPVTNRLRDLATAIAIAFMLGQYNNIAVRVTDGTDTAATGTLKDGSNATGATLTGFYTGSLGNSLVATTSTGTKANSYKVTLALPGFQPEIFDNLTQGVSSANVTPGTGYTSVPNLAISAPQGANGVQATANATLKVVSANVSGGGANAGSGYTTGDTITLSNGVVLGVTATAGAITALSVTNAGSLTGGSIPTNPVAQQSTSGAGTGALVNLVWGLGPVSITNPGSGYTSATATLSGGGAGTGGSVVLATSIWLNLVNAINQGQSGVRGPSQLAIATIGTSAAAPALASVTLSGGTDGAAGVTDASLIGANTTPPSGMYALQSSGVQTMNLVDHSTSSQWSTMGLFGQQFGVFGAAQGQPGQSISTVSTSLNTAGVDTYGLKALVGDWVYWQDNVNNVQRLVGPATIWGPMRANLAPNQSTLNKPVQGIIGTQRSVQQVPYSGPETLSAVQARLDFLANPSPGGNYFGFQTDRNTSSDASTNSESYTTMTNFIALTLAANFGYVVGNPQTDDLRTEARDAITAWLSTLWLVNKYIGDVNNPTKQPYKVTLDESNNPDSNVSLGIMQCLVQVKFQSIVREFLISLQGGSTVSVSVS
ncbi:hypothetical protein F4827_003087 [Paraburkholderia bannensis]|uniref:Phage tail protein n=1 Tax=Paraburkholderia bannensis TaxID=765414 RepID=A0A7W9TXH2_9BURK|nr:MULTISPECIES: hypothetical protein [Paraburkholderia]MBB3258219.1 hypothetical protein [Paraburkholderia sp. WP4_3_2]MBB6103232.1 hypothetical protein [Paraburkholderia bannensis]